MAEEAIRVQIVYALPHAQEVIAIRVPVGTTVAEAIEHSGVCAHCGLEEPHALQVGIYGRTVQPDTVLRANDRVEIYRPLIADPKQARRRRAARAR